MHLARCIQSVMLVYNLSLPAEGCSLHTQAHLRKGRTRLESKDPTAYKVCACSPPGVQAATANVEAKALRALANVPAGLRSACKSGRPGCSFLRLSPVPRSRVCLPFMHTGNQR